MVGIDKDVLLETRNLCSGYRRKNILKGIDFLVRKGEFWGLIGPNGSGKTTLLKSMTNILPAQKGNVFYNKEDIMKIPAKKLAQNIAVVPQVSVFHFSFTVQDFVLLGRIPYLPRFYLEGKNDYRIAEEAMQLTETISFRQRRINELSEGEKQRVVIARSLAQKPTILLLDEPAAHLDIRHQLDVFNLLEKLNQKKGITIILVSHDLNLASQYASQLILLNEGKIFARGRPKEIINEENIWKVYGVKVKLTPGIKGNPLVNIFI